MWHGRPRRDERARYRIYRAGAYARRIETAGHAMSSSRAIKTGLWPATNPVPDQFDVFSSSMCGKAEPPRIQVRQIRRVRARFGEMPRPHGSDNGAD